MKAVQKTVSSLDGVEKAEVDFDSKTVTITMKAGKTLTKEALDKAFEGSKFSVSSFETVEAAPEKKDEKDPKKEDGK